MDSTGSKSVGSLLYFRGKGSNMNSGISTCGEYVKTEHFIQRQQQRRISDEQVELTLQLGCRFYEGEELVYFVGRKHLPCELDPKLADRTNGTVVVVGAEGNLLTTYRNPRFIKELKRRHS